MKAYQKPVLYYEKVELSQHIASCDFKLNFGLGSGCTAKGEVWGVPFEGIFINPDAACTVPQENYCYTNSAAIVGTHTS